MNRITHNSMSLKVSRQRLRWLRRLCVASALIRHYLLPNGF